MRWLGWMLPLLLTVACVIPDEDILIEDEFQNRHAVRIVEPVQLTPEAEAACDDVLAGNIKRCPQPPPTLPTHFLDPNLPDYEFCSCDKAAGQRDTNALGTFSLYAEDGDRDEDDKPEDELYGAFLLDVEPESPNPVTFFVNYTSYLDAETPAPAAGLSDYDDAIGRPSPEARQFLIDDGTEAHSVDLCNGALGENALERGWHTVQFIVTDRFWFTPVIFECPGGGTDCSDADKVPATDGDGTVLTAPPQIGVPDVAAGATYDSTSFHFFCRDALADPDVFPEDAMECQDQCE